MNSNEKKLGDYVDLDRYPIHQLDSEEGNALISRCHAMMANDTICVLPGFLRKASVDQLTEEITGLEPVARKIDFLSTMYGWMNNAGFPSEHPRSQLLRRHCGVITTDQIQSQGDCMQLFQFDQLTEFVRRLLNYETLYRSACPQISVRINLMESDDEFGWHFDTNDGVVSFIIQNAEQGGVFEYAPLIRSEEDENYEGVEAILTNAKQAKQADLPPGTFTLFLGRRSLHRVSRVGDSATSRQSLLFSYDRKPDMVFPEKIRNRLLKPSSEPFLGAVTGKSASNTT